MKNTYVKPEMQVEEFLANQYVAACGDSGKIYSFICNAGLGYTHEEIIYHFGWTERKQVQDKFNVYKSDGTKLVGSGKKFTSYHPCGETHSAPSDGEFFSGYIDDQETSAVEHIPVVIWTGKNKDNVHCTTNLDIETWETAKS